MPQWHGCQGASTPRAEAATNVAAAARRVFCNIPNVRLNPQPLPIHLTTSIGRQFIHHLNTLWHHISWQVRFT